MELDLDIPCLATYFPYKSAVEPPLDPGFRAASIVNRAFRRAVAESGGGVPLRLGLERADGSVATFDTQVFGRESPHFAANLPYVERMVKFLLWQRGGWRVYVGGPAEIGRHIEQSYAAGGARA